MVRRRVEFALFAVAAIVGLAADLGSKSWVFAAVEHRQGQPIVLIPDWLRLVSRLNEGGIWSIGAQFGQHANSALILFASVASLLILTWAYLFIRPGERIFPMVLGGIFAGALGNLHDRYFFQGVRDWIEFHYQKIWYYPTFNLADSMLICGGALIVLASLFQPSNNLDRDGAATSPAPGHAR